MAHPSLALPFVTAGVKRQILRMGSEIMREVGVLLIVFAPLDALFAKDALTLAAIAAIVVGAFLFVVVGMA
jgi:hypothetical protein